MGLESIHLDLDTATLVSPTLLVQLFPAFLLQQSSPNHLFGREMLRLSQRLILLFLESTLLDTAILDYLPLLNQLPQAMPVQLESLLSPDQFLQATLDFLPSLPQLFPELLPHQSSQDHLALEDLDSGKQPSKNNGELQIFIKHKL